MGMYLVQSNLNYLDSLRLEEIVRIIEGPGLHLHYPL